MDESRKPDLFFLGFDFRNQFHHSLLLVTINGPDSFSVVRSLGHSLRQEKLQPRKSAQLFRMLMQSRPEFRENLCKVGSVRCYSQSAEFADAAFKTKRWHESKIPTSQGKNSIPRFW